MRQNQKRKEKFILSKKKIKEKNIISKKFENKKIKFKSLFDIMTLSDRMVSDFFPSG